MPISTLPWKLATMLSQLIPFGLSGLNGSVISVESQPIHGSSSSLTTTMNEQLELLLLVSVTIHVTVVVPIAKS